eukprot:4972954-Pyramimonas_sp.AAC.1
MPHWVCGTHADGGTGAFGGTSCGATKRCNGWVKMPKLMLSGRTRTVPLGASRELSMWPRSAVLSGEDACGR